jgi:hypothetical protein
MILVVAPAVEWDPVKAATNEAKHRLSFEEASTLFTSGVDYLEILDEAGSADEPRFIAIGPVRAGVIVVVFTERADDIIRIISARRATRQEAALFRASKGLRP